MTLEDLWQHKSDEDVVEATTHLDDYTAEVQQVLLAEMRRRGLPEPSPVVFPMTESPRAVQRKPWQAALLSLLLPGLGQVYNGQARKAALLYCLYWLVGLACLVTMLEFSLAPLNIALPTGIFLASYLFILVDAIKTASRQREPLPRKWYQRWYVYVALLVLFPFVIHPIFALTLREVWVQAFKIPSQAMETTLLIGDHILVNKFLYYSMPPQRQDIVVFHYPWEEDRTFLQRIIGLPGDRVHLHGRQVYVNDQLLHEPYAHYTTSPRQDVFGPVVVPKKGDQIEIRSDRRLYLNGTPVSIPSNPYHPSGLFQFKNDRVPMTGFEVFYGRLFPPGTALQQPLAPRTVEHDYYFVLGDNRDNSQDSRYWGFVRRASILGAAQRLYWSWDRSARRVRWDRIGQEIR